MTPLHAFFSWLVVYVRMDLIVAIMYRSGGPGGGVASIAALKMYPMFTPLNMDVHRYTPMNQPWWRNLLFSHQHRHLDHCEGPQKSRSNCNSVWFGIVKVHGWSMTPVSQHAKLLQVINSLLTGLRKPIQNHHPDALGSKGPTDVNTNKKGSPIREVCIYQPRLVYYILLFYYDRFHRQYMWHQIIKHGCFIYLDIFWWNYITFVLFSKMCFLGSSPFFLGDLLMFGSAPRPPLPQRGDPDGSWFGSSPPKIWLQITYNPLKWRKSGVPMVESMDVLRGTMKQTLPLCQPKQTWIERKETNIC